MKIRAEHFGGIVQIDRPAMTVFVDRDFMRRLGEPESPLWTSPDPGYLSAPINAHVEITGRCPWHCEICYSSSGPDRPEPSFEDLLRTFDVLADMRVFTVPFGGGEPLMRDDVFDLAQEARQRGLRPTMTTNGLLITQQVAERCRVFDHIHISLDLERDAMAPAQGYPNFEAQVRMLHGAGIRIGVNFVLTRRGFECLEEVGAMLKRRKVRDLMLLRFKPAGRGAGLLDSHNLTPEQQQGLFTAAKQLYRKYRLLLSADCALLPLFSEQKINLRRADFFAAQGCQGGNHLIEVDISGQVRACSFAQDRAGPIADLPTLWHEAAHFNQFRNWAVGAPNPCHQCELLNLCRGGCHAVSAAVLENWKLPDPECPRVRASVQSR